MNIPVSHELAQLLREKKINIYSEYRYTDFNGIEKLEKDASEVFPYAPTIAEVVMWLYEKHGIWIQAMIYRRNPNDFIGGVYYGQLENYFTKPYNTPTEAYEAAIEYVLNNLI